MVRSAGAVPSTIAAMMRGDREGEGSEKADVAFDPALPLGNLGEGGNAAEPDIVDPSTGLGDGGEQPRFVLRRLYHPENSDVRRLALSDCGHAVTVDFPRPIYFVSLSSCASAFSNERVGRGARPEFPCRLRSRQLIRA